MQALAMPASRYIFGTLPWYSVTMVSAIIVALFLAQREEKRRGLPKDTVIDLALWLIPCGIIGARLYYVAFTWDLFRENPIAILQIWKGGLAIYGGLLGGLAAAAVFAWRRKLNLLTLADMIVPGLALAQCIGRWGNYFNMEAYGLPITDPVWQFFPFGVLIPEAGGTTWHLATFFYESLWDLGVFLALRALRKPCRRPGDLTAWYVLLYGAGRLVIEGLRMDSLMTSSGSVRISQFLSVLGCLAVFLLLNFHALKGLPRRRWWAGLLTALGVTALAALLPHPADAFWGYRPVFCLHLGLVAGSIAALTMQRPGRRLLWMLPAALALIAETALSVAFAGHAFSPGLSTAQSTLFSLCLIAACAGIFPFGLKSAAAAEDSPADPTGSHPAAG